LGYEQGLELDAVLEIGKGLKRKGPLGMQRELAVTGFKEYEEYTLAVNMRNPACPMYLGESDEGKELFQQMEERCHVKPVGVFDDQEGTGLDNQI
jgi:hypothetical protein